MKVDKHIYIINGTGGSGKDTLCNIVADKYERNNFQVRSISSVDQVKECAKILGWDGVSKNENDRKFLSDLKDLATRYCDSPFKYEYKRILEFMGSSMPGILFIHIREPEEIAKLVLTFPVIETIYVVNDNIPKITSNHADANTSNYEYDHYIYNNGTLEEYKSTIINWFDEVIYGED